VVKLGASVPGHKSHIRDYNLSFKRATRLRSHHPKNSGDTGQQMLSLAAHIQPTPSLAVRVREDSAKSLDDLPQRGDRIGNAHVRYIALRIGRADLVNGLREPFNFELNSEVSPSVPLGDLDGFDQARDGTRPLVVAFREPHVANCGFHRPMPRTRLVRV